MAILFILPNFLYNIFQVGSTLLRKLGWKSGEGIGKGEGVVTAPIQVEILF